MTILKAKNEVFILGTENKLFYSDKIDLVKKKFNPIGTYWMVKAFGGFIKAREIAPHEILTAFIKSEKGTIVKIDRKWPMLAIVKMVVEGDIELWVSSDLVELVDGIIDDKKEKSIDEFYVLQPLIGTLKNLELESFLRVMDIIRKRKKKEREENNA